MRTRGSSRCRGAWPQASRVLLRNYPLARAPRRAQNGLEQIEPGELQARVLGRSAITVGLVEEGVLGAQPYCGCNVAEQVGVCPIRLVEDLRGTSSVDIACRVARLHARVVGRDEHSAGRRQVVLNANDVGLPINRVNLAIGVDSDHPAVDISSVRRRGSGHCRVRRSGKADASCEAGVVI